jgi:hypothetical protein
MGLAIVANKPGKKRSKRQVSVGKKSKISNHKVSGSKPFPWKLIFGAVAIISVMALLSSPIDPNSIKNGSSGNSGKTGLGGFSLEK